MVRLPTEKSSATDFDNLLENPFYWVAAPFFITIAVMKAILSCEAAVLQPANLTSSKLVFTIADNGGASLSGAVSISSLSKPWWQNADWTHAHYFSGRGIWASPGGDENTDQSFSAGVVNGSTIEFDVTNYFKSVITDSQVLHYGLLVKANADLPTVKFKSTQSESVLERPKLVSTYTGNCGGSSKAVDLNPRVYVLGRQK